MAEAVIAVDARRRLLFADAGADRPLASMPRRWPAGARADPQSRRFRAPSRTLARHPGAYQGEMAFPLSGAPRAAAVADAVRARHSLAGSPPSGAVLVFHDVTELRRLERMRQDFVANASHELKTPLASIKAYTETLIDWAIRDETVNGRSWTGSRSRPTGSTS